MVLKTVLGVKLVHQVVCDRGKVDRIGFFNLGKMGPFVTGQAKSSLLLSEASLSLLTFESHMQSTSVFSRDVLDIIEFWKN